LSASLSTVGAGLETIREVVPQLEAELKLRTAAIERLQAESKSLDHLMALKQVETSAVQELIAQTVHRGQVLAARSTWKRDILYLVMGLVLSLPLGVMVNFAYDQWIK